MNPTSKNEQIAEANLMPGLEADRTQANANPELASQASAAAMPVSSAVPASNPPGLSTTTTAQNLTGDSQSNTAQPQNLSTPSTADDGDVIEKEWVMKVKQIVHHTIGDPYAQTKAMNQLRADYVKKRYGKEIKMIE